jgi:hypothetical protein
MIKIGTSILKKRFVGAAEVIFVYVGLTLVYKSATKYVSDFVARVAADGGLSLSQSCLKDTLSKYGSLNKASLVLIPNSYKTGKVYSVIPDSGTGDLVFTRSTPTTFINSSTGLLETLPVDVPQIRGNCPGYISQYSGTNLALYSQDFSQASWVKTNSTVSNPGTIVAPDGTSTGTELTDDATNGVHSVTQTITAGALHNYSVYIKKPSTNALSYIRLSVVNAANSLAFVTAQITLPTNSTIIAGSAGGGNPLGFPSLNVVVDVVGNGWYRIGFTGNITGATSVSIRISGSDGAALTSSDPNGERAYIGGGQSVYIWGVQHEQSYYRTPYIVTQGASVARSNDKSVLTNLIAKSILPSTSGTILAVLNENTNARRGFSFYLESADTLNGIYFGASSNSLRAVEMITRINGGSYSARTSGMQLTIVVKWDGAVINAFSSDGSKLCTDVVFVPTTPIDTLILTGSNKPDNIKTIMLFPTALTDAECIALAKTV